VERMLAGYSCGGSRGIAGQILRTTFPLSSPDWTGKTIISFS
jgi:hypothetical protein